MHSVLLVKVHKFTPQNSLDKAVDLLYWIMPGATAFTQSLLLVTSPMGIVLPVEKMSVSGVMVSDKYNPFASIRHILHLCTFMYKMFSTTKELVVRARPLAEHTQWLVQYVHMLAKHLYIFIV